MANPEAVEREDFIRAVAPLTGEREAGDLFCLLDRIAQARYEGAHNTAFLAFGGAGDDGVRRIVLEKPMPLSNGRGARKLLHVSAPSLIALCDGRTIHGFGAWSALPEALLSVRFDFP